MSRVRDFFVILIVLLIIISGESGKESRDESKRLKQISDTSWQELDGQDLSLKVPDYQLHILPINFYRSRKDVEAMLRSTGDTSNNYLYRHDSIGTYTMSAQGLDKRQHLVNSYLEGFAPFPVENVTTPLYILAQRKRYLLDDKQYAGRSDVWQSSRQAYYYSRGDCEDHALALADWLIAMGEDARVAVGDVDGNGHAWVVLFRDNREFLLEATQKRGINSAYPLASLHQNYHPQYMFNREYFWENTGSKFTTRYSGTHWKKQSHYQVIDKRT